MPAAFKRLGELAAVGDERRPHRTIFPAMRSKPRGEVLRNLDQPAARGLCLGSADVDEAAVQVDVTPIESCDLGSAQSGEQADGHGGKDLRLTGHKQRLRLGDGQDADFRRWNFDLHRGGHRVGGTIAARDGEPEKIVNRAAVVRLRLRTAGQAGKPFVDVAGGYLGGQAVAELPARTLQDGAVDRPGGRRSCSRLARISRSSSTAEEMEIERPMAAACAA